MKKESNSTAIYVENADSSKSLSEEKMRLVPNSPFVSFELEGKYYLVMGRFRLHEEGLGSHEEVFALANQKSWDLIMRVIAAFTVPLPKQDQQNAGEN